MNENPNPTTLLITHTDRDGLLSGAALLRSLGETESPGILITQGSYLASELEDLVREGRSYERIFVTDTYWHPPQADRVVAGLQAILADGGTVAWIDHHPSSVEHEDHIRVRLPLSPRSSIIGDRAGKFEAVSLVAQAFGTAADPVVATLLKAVANGWSRRGEPVPQGVSDWMAVVDGLARCPDLPPQHAADIVRSLANGFDTPIPAHLQPLQALTRRVQARTVELLRGREWQQLPSAEGGHGILLDLHDEPEVNSYELLLGLAKAAEGRVDYFVTQDHPGSVHYVSGPSARAERDVLERGGGMPHLRVSTLHKGCRRSGMTWRARKGIDLAYFTRRQPASEWLGPWIDAHPYIVKAPWRRGFLQAGDGPSQAAEIIGKCMRDMLTTFGWSDEDRCCTARKPAIGG